MKLKIGDSASYKKSFSIEEHRLHLACINDSNPLHYDEEYARTTVFKKPIVQGALTSGLVSGLLGSTLPGKDTIYLGQHFKYLQPIYINETVTAIVTIVNIRKDKPIVTLRTQIFKENSELAIDGEAVVMVPKNTI